VIEERRRLGLSEEEYEKLPAAKAEILRLEEKVRRGG